MEKSRILLLNSVGVIFKKDFEAIIVVIWG